MLAAETAVLASGEAVTAIAGAIDWRQGCGYLASVLVLATFWMRQMVPLRVVAICSNVAFFSYAVLLGLPPVAILHATLLPVNLWRLGQFAKRGETGAIASPRLERGLRLAARGGLAAALSLFFIGAASSNTFDDEIHCRIEHWRSWSPACHNFAKAEYLLVAQEMRRQAQPAQKPHGPAMHSGLRIPRHHKTRVAELTPRGRPKPEQVRSRLSDVLRRDRRRWGVQ
jgi:hypothetical protein